MDLEEFFGLLFSAFYRVTLHFRCGVLVFKMDDFFRLLGFDCFVASFFRIFSDDSSSFERSERGF